MKRIVSLLLLSCLLVTVILSTTACGKPTVVCIEVKDFGNITVELDKDAAPKTVKNFVSLVESGFYDGLTFHRIIKGFMIQGGDPKGDGTGGSDTNIKGEFSMNGVKNPIDHKRGVISMARSGSVYEQYISYGYYTYDTLPAEAQADIKEAWNSASSQFFIVHEDSPHLNGNYAAFGYVIDGMDVVDAIASVSVNSNDKPLDTVTINRIYIVE